MLSSSFGISSENFCENSFEKFFQCLEQLDNFFGNSSSSPQGCLLPKCLQHSYFKSLGYCFMTSFRNFVSSLENLSTFIKCLVFLSEFLRELLWILIRPFHFQMPSCANTYGNRSSFLEFGKFENFFYLFLLKITSAIPIENV